MHWIIHCTHMHLTDRDCSSARRVTVSIKQTLSQSGDQPNQTGHSLRSANTSGPLSQALCKVKNIVKSVNIDYSNTKLIKRIEEVNIVNLKKVKPKLFPMLLPTQHPLAYLLFPNQRLLSIYEHVRSAAPPNFFFFFSDQWRGCN